MKALDKKLLRDLQRLWPQALAISLVLACGVATLILSIGSYRSLFETRQAYYERHHFASIFASATRAPQSLIGTIGKIPGVAAAEGRIVEPALLDITGMREPASATVISLPDQGESRLNRLYLQSGRLPETGKRGEVVVSEAFAKEHGFRAGGTIAAIIAGHKVTFHITGLVMSPEFIYAVGPGDLIPDDRRYAIIWMRRGEMSGMTQLDDAFNSVSVSLLPWASHQAIIQVLDQKLKPFGGTGAYPRKDQFSHAFLDSELEQLRAMARVLPPIFLFVSAFLINMILSRLVALEREQIGLLKALGYGRFAISMHYTKLVMAIAILGAAIGAIAGTWLGNGLTRLYADFFHFPFLIFRRTPDIYVLATTISLAAAVIGGLRSVLAAVALPAAAAMRPAAPTLYRRASWIGRWLASLVSQLTVMAIRHLIRWPLRSFLTMLGTALAVALLVTAVFSFGSINALIDTVYFRTERQDATISFSSDLAPAAVHAAQKLPGIMAVEPYRAVMAEISHGSHSRRIAITGKPKEMRLSRILDLDLVPVSLPQSGLVLSERVAHHLKARRGDIVHLKLLAEGWHEAELPVVDIIQSYFGLGAYMDIDALDRLSRTGPRRSGVHVELDPAAHDAIYKAVKALPKAASIALQSESLKKFRETIEQNISIMTSVYVVLAVIIAFGVVYNSARILLSERARELASLRVLGFTKGEVASVLMIELAVITIIAQPVGWLLGYGFSWAMVQGFQTDLFRIPFIVLPSSFGWSSTLVVTASALSALIVVVRVRRLDMIRVLKTKE